MVGGSGQNTLPDGARRSTRVTVGTRMRQPHLSNTRPWGGGGGETKESNADDGVAVRLPADLPEEGPLPLGLFKNQATLAGVGMDRLKTALLAVGFKCGGSLEQRAERLWDAKEAMDGGKALDKYSFAKVR